MAEDQLAWAPGCITVGNEVNAMLIATSKVTRQGQISVPARVRRDLGLRAGCELIWDWKENGEYVVRPKRVTLAELHALVGTPAAHLSDEDLREARHEFLASRIKRLDPKKG